MATKTISRKDAMPMKMSLSSIPLGEMPLKKNRVRVPEHMEIGSAVNTHLMYATVYHEHFDTLVYWTRDELIDSGLNLGKYADSR